MANLDGVRHGVLVLVPVSLMQKTGTYYFVLRVWDNHANLHKDHQVKPALEMNAKVHTERHLPVHGFRTPQGQWDETVYGRGYSCSVLVAYMCYKYEGGKKTINEFFQYLVQAHQQRSCQNQGCFDNAPKYDPMRFCIECVHYAFKELIKVEAEEEYDFTANLLVANTTDEQAREAIKAIERTNPLWALLFEHYDSHAVCFHGYGRCPDQEYWFCGHDPFQGGATELAL